MPLTGEYEPSTWDWVAGDPTHPAWYHNLVAEPLVEIQDGAAPHDDRTEIITGAERQVWWKRGVEIYPPYADYQAKTDREIPVYVARRID
jgi:deazaflavin-dependent oxidoreductase (nitroreductase family)